MRRWVVLLTAAFLSLCLLCGCGANESGGAAEPEPLHEGETYLDGFWYLEEDDLHVGYNLFPDGGGFLFIGETVIPIRYGIYGGDFYEFDGNEVKSRSFQAGEDGIWIGGMLYRPLEEDPEVSSAVEMMRSEAERAEQTSASSEASPQIGKTVMQLVTLAAAVGVVVILVGFLRKRKKNS